jgi:hypothetical protein
VRLLKPAEIPGIKKSLVRDLWKYLGEKQK